MKFHDDESLEAMYQVALCLVNESPPALGRPTFPLLPKLKHVLEQDIIIQRNYSSRLFRFELVTGSHLNERKKGRRELMSVIYFISPSLG